MNTHARCLIVAPLSFLAACGQSSDTDAILDTIRMSEQAQLEAIASNDVHGAARIYHNDAVMVIPSREPAVGSPAVRDIWKDLLADSNLAVRATPGTGWVSASGNVAGTTFTADYTTTDPVTGKPVTLPIENQTLWRKVEGGGWLIILDVNVEAPTVADGAKEVPPGDSIAVDE